jgi:hypothetical protein
MMRHSVQVLLFKFGSSNERQLELEARLRAGRIRFLNFAFG